MTQAARQEPQIDLRALIDEPQLAEPLRREGRDFRKQSEWRVGLVSRTRREVTLRPLLVALLTDLCFCGDEQCWAKQPAWWTELALNYRQNC